MYWLVYKLQLKFIYEIKQGGKIKLWQIKIYKMHRCEYGMCYIWKREREREKLDSLSINNVDW